MKNIILVLTLIFISSNSIFASLEFMDGGIVKVISGPISGYSPFKVYADENWKVTETKLVTNEFGQQQFELRIQAIVPFSKSIQKRTVCEAVFSMDAGTFDYSGPLASGLRSKLTRRPAPSDHFKVDMNNHQFIENLRTLLNDCVAWTNWYEAYGSTTRGTFHGLTGDYTYIYSADTSGEDDFNKDSSIPSEMQRLVLEIQLFPGENTGGHPEKTIREPKALLSILDSLDEIQKGYQAAVDQKKQQQIAAEKESQDLANRQVSAEKTASERRLDEFKAQQEAQLRDNQKNDEIAAIKTAEETKKQEIVEQVAKEKAKEIKDFLAAPKGKALFEEIGRLKTKAGEMEASETKQLDKLHQNIVDTARIYFGTSELDERMREARDAYQLALNTHHDSPELKALKDTLNEKMQIFRTESGYSHDDAVQVMAKP
ncbi:MAG: hypothetical protein ABSF10_09865 [Verrucomicrobiota bacterium]|jgi:hypothetical protein